MQFYGQEYFARSSLQHILHNTLVLTVDVYNRLTLNYCSCVFVMKISTNGPYTYEHHS